MHHKATNSKPASRAHGSLLPMALLSIAVMGAAALYWLLEEEPRRPAVSYDIFIDQSGSITSEEQLKLWRGVFAQLLARLGPRDSLHLFGLHNQTANAAPLFQADLPDLPEDAGLEEVGVWKQQLARVREEASKAFELALQPPLRAQRTDIFSALHRVCQDQARKREIWFMSDMLNSTRELDLERTALTDQNFANLLNPIVAHHQWQPGALSGAEVHCLLNSLGIHTVPPPLNDRQTLQRFWQTLFKHLGAQIKTFETHVSL